MNKTQDTAQKCTTIFMISFLFLYFLFWFFFVLWLSCSLSTLFAFRPKTRGGCPSSRASLFGLCVPLLTGDLLTLGLKIY